MKTLSPALLPTLPSALLQIGLQDLLAIEATPGYIIDMGTFKNSYDDLCHVCLAGAVMVKSLGLQETEEIDWKLLRAHGLLAQLDFLDSWRANALKAAFDNLKIQVSDDQYQALIELSYEPYEVSPEVFKAWMQASIELLRSFGL